MAGGGRYPKQARAGGQWSGGDKTHPVCCCRCWRGYPASAVPGLGGTCLVPCLLLCVLRFGNSLLRNQQSTLGGTFL